ncbi:hypothetical protein I552_3983 [Mycobacterium xenopi 3993]|nr:hypothetical protein I552_3983 [Mycobacterium xenopi 3993]
MLKGRTWFIDPRLNVGRGHTNAAIDTGRRSPAICAVSTTA